MIHMDKVYEQKYLKYKQKYLDLKYKLIGSGLKELRNECLKKCVYPNPNDYDNLTYRQYYNMWDQCYEKCKKDYPVEGKNVIPNLLQDTVDKMNEEQRRRQAYY